MFQVCGNRGNKENYVLNGSQKKKIFSYAAWNELSIFYEICNFISQNVNDIYPVSKINYSTENIFIIFNTITFLF